MTKNMMIAQSGGPSSAINASIAGAIERALAADEIGRVFGAVNGMQGLLERRIIDISEQITRADDIDLLIHTPAQALGSSRYKLPKDDPAIFDTILGILKEYDIGYFFYNGGNDSMDTVSRLSAYFRERGEDIVALGIPKTIDNDLVETDHTPGFGSAARYVATSVAELYLDTVVYPLPSVVIVEVMGRNAGWLTAASVLARDTGVPAPHLIYLPEVPFDADDFIAKTEKLLETEGQILVAISEGIRFENGEYVADTGAAADAFGHKTLGGVATVLEDLVKQRINVPKLKTRAIQFNTLQRAAAHCASAKDLEESYQCGYRAVEAALEGKTDVMVTINRTNDEPYQSYYALAPLSGIANKEKSVPLAWIDTKNADVTEEFIRYARPLVRGEATEKFVGGLPRFFRFDWSKTVKP
ncbi:MAG: 6-phosphofructokinase [Clostridiales Family XIII bacterium]|jgi:6-phosphofructokinase 1|nr:6-phosphofructokinase [Clostridiales Family XIII bacterium]